MGTAQPCAKCKAGIAKLVDALLHRSIYMTAANGICARSRTLHKNDNFATDMADLTRLEHEARRLRASLHGRDAFAAASHGFVSLVRDTPHRGQAAHKQVISPGANLR